MVLFIAIITIGVIAYIGYKRFMTYGYLAPQEEKEVLRRLSLTEEERRLEDKKKRMMEDEILRREVLEELDN